ncbi:MAG: UDP-N-acetylmuramoyl-L-alanine--D-glutamate ligase [Fidelibacterota bacterium]
MKGKRVTVIGAGLSGVHVSNLLKKRGYEVWLSEIKLRSRCSSSIIKLIAAENIPCEMGGHSQRALEADFAVVSPGISPEVPIIKKLMEKGIPVYSEVEVSSWFTSSPIIAVTGSNGKSTTATLIHEMCKRGGFNSLLGGNIGIPFSSLILKAADESQNNSSIFVLEISSFQLERIEKFKPHISLILNITPDHLNRYANFEDYAATKLKIFSNQTDEDFLIYNADDELLRKVIPVKSRSRLCTFSAIRRNDTSCYIESTEIVFTHEGVKLRIMPVTKLALKGEHNLYNAMAATAAACLSGVNPEPIAEILQEFRGIEHRLEFVREIKGIKFINDSKATNIISLKYALKSFSNPIVLIAGGRHKGDSFKQIAHLIRERVKTLILIGEAADLRENVWGSYTTVKRAKSMEEAVKLATHAAEEGDVVLLSPGCASFDMFENFEHRGNIFKEAVLAL